jgi:hypothetical protein
MHKISYVEPLLCLRDDALDRYEMLTVALNKKTHEHRYQRGEM